jgi:Zn finger protein HypA/HybF involved in hydrogenase expression
MAGRRKLFSETATKTRRKLFSSEDSAPSSIDESLKDQIQDQYGDKVLVCMDCRTTYRTPDGGDVDATNYLCPRCGGKRFEVLENLETPYYEDAAVEQVAKSEEKDPNGLISSDLDRVFSNTRRKLFSDDPVKTVEKADQEYLYFCRDCKTAIKSDSSTPEAVICPSCGGNRVDVFQNGDNPINGSVMDPAADPTEDGCCGQEVENCEACETEFEQDRDYKIIEDLVNTFRGKNVSQFDLENYVYEKYGIEGYDIDDLVEAGYIEEIDVDPENPESDMDKILKFKDTASLQNKIFSAVKISLTKEFDLDPIMDHESVIETLGERLPEDGVSILKDIQIHARPRVVNFSEDYLVDSGISNDIKTEYGGQVMGLKEFLKILETDYPDAPDNIIDLLSSDNVIRLSGGQVEISK